MFFMLSKGQLYTQLVARQSCQAESEHLWRACSALGVVVEWTQLCEKCIAFDPLLRLVSKDVYSDVLALPELSSGLASIESSHEQTRIKL